MWKSKRSVSVRKCQLSPASRPKCDLVSPGAISALVYETQNYDCILLTETAPFSGLKHIFLICIECIECIELWDDMPRGLKCTCTYVHVCISKSVLRTYFLIILIEFVQYRIQLRKRDHVTSWQMWRPLQMNPPFIRNWSVTAQFAIINITTFVSI